MIKRLILAVIIFAIASSAGFFMPKDSTLKAFTVNASTLKDQAAAGFFDVKKFDVKKIDETDRVVLPGNVHPEARAEYDAGPSDPTLPMKGMILLLKIAPEKQAALDRLAAEQQDSSSPNYHKWLTPEEFGERFGRSAQEIATVEGWLISHGFSIDNTDINSTLKRGGVRINFSGTAANVDSAFHAQMHDYLVNGQLRHANSTDPSIPRALADVVAGPVALHNFPRKPMHRKRPVGPGAGSASLDGRSSGQIDNLSGSSNAIPTPAPAKAGPAAIPSASIPAAGPTGPQYTEQDNGGYDLAPGDFAVIYDVKPIYSQNWDGAGVTIALVEQTNPGTIGASKWRTFRSTFGLSTSNLPNVIVNGVDPGDTGYLDDTEADLDAEWAGAVAPGAVIDFVASTSVDLSAQYIVEQNHADIVSYSYGTCESQNTGSFDNLFYYNLWEQAAAQGQSVFVCTGDSGAFACDNTNANGNLTPQGKAVNGLASTPFNTAVGGTTLSGESQYWNTTNSADGVSALSYMPETAWNEYNAADGWYEWASGGGASSIYPKPAWQVSPGVPSANHRYLPDVSLNASTIVGYRVFTCNENVSSSCATPYSMQIFGGTSAATPTMAAIAALIVQSEGYQRLGNINSALYRLANAQYKKVSGASAVFHDITSGTNGFVGDGVDLIGYSCTATPSYNEVTGLGSVDALKLLDAFNGLGQGGGSITVTILPAAAATGGAAWNIDGAQTWYASGATAPVSPGSHTVGFKPVTGWQAPSGQPVTAWYAQEATASAAYVLLPPTVASFSIDGGAGTAPSRTVTLDNTIQGVASYYRASESSTLAGAAWRTCSAAPSFTLSAANGQKTVYFQVKNTAGVSTPPSSASIILAPVPVVTSFRIDAGAASTTNPAVTLNNAATQSPTQYIASEDPTFNGASPQTYSTDPPFTFTSAGGGKKTVYFAAINGNGPSPTVSDTIELYVQPAVTSFYINNQGDTTTATRRVTLTNTATGPPTSYMASESPTFAGAAWIAYPASGLIYFNLSAVTGTQQTVYFKVRNAAGISTSTSTPPSSASIIYTPE